MDAGLIGGDHRAKLGGSLAAQKIAQLLPRCHIVRSASHKGQSLPVTLEFDAGQRTAGVIAARIDIDHNSRIGVEFSARILAHPVGDQMAFLRGGGHHTAARTHAEAVGRPPVAGLVRQAVGRGSQDLVASVRPEPRLVDPALRMLDPHPDGKGLGLDMNAPVINDLKGVAGAVANCEDHVFGGKILPGAELQTAHLPRSIRRDGDIEIIHAGSKPIFSAERLDCLADAHHHGDQPESADMRMRLGQDFLGRSGLDEFGQHLAAKMARILDPAVELAVGECSGAAFTKLRVGFRLEHPAPPQAPGVLGPLAHRCAAFDDNRAESHLRQHQRGQQPARSCTDHHRARAGIVFRRAGDEAIGGIGRRPHMRIIGKARQHRLLVRHHQIERIDQPDRMLLARVIAAPGHGKPLQLGRGDFQPRTDRLGQCLRGMVKRKQEVSQADQCQSPPGDWPWQAGQLTSLIYSGEARSISLTGLPQGWHST